MTLLNRLAIHRAGGRSVVISPRRPFPAERPVGLVIGGGDDIGPVVEAGALEPALRIDRARDRLERRLLDDLAGPGFPILGICRGAQMLNLHRGGTLHADIYAAYAGARRLRTVLPRKRVAIRPGTRLAGIIGR
ncbi:MAG: gamma-glutamyl-gamma-aminobutyrate hydrolase family protein, partial [Alphaproteobacteria bacterium]